MENVINKLRAWAEEIANDLRQESLSDSQRRADLIALRSEISCAVQRLVLCEKWGINPRSRIQVLPAQKCRTPSSEYRIMEDCETDDRHWWVEADFDGQVCRPNEGDLIIQRRNM